MQDGDDRAARVGEASGRPSSPAPDGGCRARRSARRAAGSAPPAPARARASTRAPLPARERGKRALVEPVQLGPAHRARDAPRRRAPRPRRDGDARPIATTSRTVNANWSTVCCGSTARSRASSRVPDAARAGGRQSSTVPRVGSSSPASRRSSVDLPAPFGPDQRQHLARRRPRRRSPSTSRRAADREDEPRAAQHARSSPAAVRAACARSRSQRKNGPPDERR